MAAAVLSGIGVSEGIRFGKALVYQALSENKSKGELDFIPVDGVERELSRLHLAKNRSASELSELYEQTKQKLGEDKAAIISAQQAFLEDPAFFPEMQNLIQNQRHSAEHAVNEIVEKFAVLFDGMDNEYFRERAADIRDLGRRLLSVLQGNERFRLTDIKEEVILVADDLAPSDTVQLDKRYILGFVTRNGGQTSHTAILSRSLGIPAIVGLGQKLKSVQNGDSLIIDGAAGVCIVHPPKEKVAEYEERYKAEVERTHRLAAYTGQPAVTKDGFRVELAGNIGTPAEAISVLKSGAEGIGLYRTEFLFMNSSELPGEDEQYEAYKEVAVAMGEKPVIIRTLDIGGDKELPYLSLPKELNPFLGYRAIRLSLDRKELLLTQLRAIIRASAHGNLKIMFPMISSLEEWRQAKEMYGWAREQLIQEGVPLAHSIELGIMVEIPSAAIMADIFAKEVGFFSIGTNDLVQYTLAVDRMNENVAYLYDYFHPAVIRLIKQVIEAAHREGKWAGMCGGMAGDPLAAPLLVGLKLDEWSMDAGSINKVKQVIDQVSLSECQHLLKSLEGCRTAKEIRAGLEKVVNQLEL